MTEDKNTRQEIPLQPLRDFLEKAANEAWEAQRLQRIEEKLDRLLVHAEGRLQHVPGIGWGTIL